MFKMVTLISRKKGMTKDAFREHYEKIHMPLSHTLFPEVIKCVRNYPTTENFHYVGAGVHPTVPCDVVTEHYFPDQETYDQMMANFASDPEKFRLLSEDEDSFCDKESMIMFLVDQEVSP